MVLALKRNDPRLMQSAENRLLSLQVSPRTIANLKRRREIQRAVTFYAPQSGVVTELQVREGFYIEPATTLMSIGSLERVWVNAEVFERQALQISLDTKVTMHLDALPGRRWQGTIDHIHPSLDTKTRTLKVRLGFDNPDAILKPNMFAQVQLTPDKVESVLQVPSEAVIRTGSHDRVVLAMEQGLQVN